MRFRRLRQIIAEMRPGKKRLLLGFGIAGFLSIAFVAIGGLVLGGHGLVELVDSPAFCTACHDVHYGEAVTYQVSPHSKVSCASCHVGSGTKNLVMSKLKGLSDILPTITGKYQRPIPTPLSDRRPSSETCETCHWSEKFFGDVPRVKTSFSTDEFNTRKTETLVLKLGGGKEEVASGIHWHGTAKIWYLPSDDKLQKIAWVATENASGNITMYVDPARLDEITPESIENGKRLMDCMDCHNRVTHLFRSPDELIDAALADGSIDADLPFIKKEVLRALVPQNKSLGEAYDKVAKIREFYQSSYPEIFRQKEIAIVKAIAKLKEIAKLTTFSDGLDWNTYPDNATHDKPDADMIIDWEALSTLDESTGCFRCHGNLVKVNNSGVTDFNVIIEGIKLNNITLASTDSDNTSYSDNSSGNLILSSNISDNTRLSDNSITSNISDNTSLSQLNLKKLSLNGGGPGKGKLDAECRTCHYTLASPLVSPIAPATSHPVDGLDECLVCHNPSATRPFKTDHPWTTNEACNSCHQSAPKLKTLPLSTPPEKAKDIPHSTTKLEDCLVCHSPSATSPISANHPWSTNDTCSSCHKSALISKPLPVSAPPDNAPQITHSVKKLEDCLSCHGPSSAKPFAGDHPWSTNETCSTCHKPAPVTLSLPLSAAPPTASPVNHSLSGLPGCTTCHNQSGPGAFPADHDGRPESFCLICHKAGNVPTAIPSQLLPSGKTITHSLSGLPGCTTCHNQSGPAPFPADHAGRPESFCLLCHKPASIVSTAPTVSTVPSAPTSLAGTVASATQVNLSWADNANNEMGYIIQRATNNSFSAGLVTVNVSANVATYSDLSVSGSTTYYYRVYATNSAGNSGASNTASVTTPAASGTVPAAPTSLAGTAVSATQVNLSWTDNANNETGHIIQRAGNNTFTSGVITINLSSNVVTYSDLSVSGSTTYYYRVYATNSSGNSVASNVVSVTTPAPLIDAAALYSGNCASCHGANRQGGSASALTSSALSSRTLAQVTAVITNGTSGMPGYSSTLSSAQISALAQFLKGTQPAVPTNVAATAPSAGQVELTWQDSATDETGFRIERATNDTFTANLITFNVAANAVSYSDTTVSGNTRYYYRIYAINSAGSSAASNICSVTTPASTATLPTAPSSLTATAPNAGQVELTWRDNANSETGFRIERATNNTFTTNLVIANAATNAVSYSDTTVSGSTTYYYRVFAFNSAGNSAASNTVSVTTPALLIDAAALYSSNCASCHGANREGTVAGPALTETALSSRTTSQIMGAIANGVGTMPGYSTVLSTAQIDTLAQYLKGSTVVTVPPSPTSLVGTAVGATRVNLSWTDNANNETGFIIQRASNNSFSAGLVTVNVSANVVTYSDLSVSGSTTYYYRVYATNSAGNSGASNIVSVTTPAASGTVPAAPTSLAGTAVSATQVNLSWTDNANNETGHIIQRAGNNTFTSGVITINLSSNVVTYSDLSVSGSTTYYYRVYATNSSGNSVASNVVSVTTPAPVPPPLIPHTTSGYTDCLACHAESSFRPFPSNHVGRTNSTCTTCHQASGSTAAPTLSVGAPGIDHNLDSAHQDCLSCHGPGRSRPFPSSHIGYQNITCRVCHQPGD